MGSLGKKIVYYEKTSKKCSESCEEQLVRSGRDDVRK
jgi:hypothetical protein